MREIIIAFMLSILIPVYNYDINPLVNELNRQAVASQILFEILVVDDASDSKYQQLNQGIGELSTVQYRTLEKNIGRSRIRNSLAELAKYSYLLFMDCDSMPINEQYIQNYITRLAPDTLLYGGRVYESDAPKDRKYYFHWYYGTRREATEAKTRRTRPYDSFMTNNFLIPKRIFQTIRFEEQLTQYGHEDTLFGLELKKRGIEIQHLDNPLIHIGLDSTKAFLNKTIKGVENLHYLDQRYELGDAIKLLNSFKKLRRLRLLWLIKLIYQLSEEQIRKTCYSQKPKLKAFDLFKLYHLIRVNQQQ